MALPTLIQAMLDVDFYPHPVSECHLIETHISWVILTGDYAYKIKKPIDLGFLDFSSLEKRHHYCEEELRLNRRLAPSIYLEVLSIGGSPKQPLFGATPSIEYAVRMRQFDPDRQLDHLLAQGRLDTSMLAAFAEKVASFHHQIALGESPSEYGTPAAVWQPMAQNFAQIRAHLAECPDDQRLSRLEQWSEQQYRQHEALLHERWQQGFVRECHGDMHLANMAWLKNEPLIFDGIEFNPALRWIDVISEVAFLVMDLHQHRRGDLAWHFLNIWLEHSGDYASLPLLHFYLVYRAMVRAKIAAIRLSQLHSQQADSDAARRELDTYLTLAEQFTQTQPARLLLCHGLSGSGKSHLGMHLLEQIGGVRLRSDVERKRLFGLAAQQRGGEGLYQHDATAQTYRRLLSLAETLLCHGYTVLVDATFLDPAQRVPFRQLAAKLDCGFFILSFQASETTLRQRLAQRTDDASDANNEVLSLQLANWQPLSATEQAETLFIDTEQSSPLQPVVLKLSTTSTQNDAGKDG